MTIERKSAGDELIDLLDRVLDKGIVVDASSRLSLGAANLSGHKKQVVIAAIETHLQHGEARAVTKFAKRRAIESAEHAPVEVRRLAGRGRG